MKNYLLWLLLLAASLKLNAQTNAAWQQTSGPEGGYVFNMERNSSKIFAGTENGLWSSSDEGQSWQSVNPAFRDIRIVAQYATDNELLVLGIKFMSSYDEEPYFFRSTDNGFTWTQTGIYQNPPYIYLSTSGDNVKTWRDQGRIWIKSSGNLYYSNDNGLNWVQVMEPPDDYFSSVAVDGNKILAYSYYAEFRSDDLGVTWTEKPDTSYNRDLFGDGSDLLKLNLDSIFYSPDFGQTWTGAPTDLYSLEGLKKSQNGDFLLFQNGIARSQDGIHWQPVTPNGQYFNIFSGVESSNSYIVGGSAGISHTIQNNTQIEPYQQGFIGNRINAISALPSGKLVLSTTYNGIWSSINDGLSWTKALAPISSIYQNIGLQEMVTKGDTLWAIGSNDSVYIQIGNSNQWIKMTDADAWFSGESFFRIIGQHLYIVEDSKIRRTKDNGATWETIATPPVNFEGLRDIAKFGNYLFFSTNGGEIYRSGDDGASWQLNYTFWSPGAHRYNKLGVSGGKLLLWSEYESFYTTDNGTTWLPLGMNGLPVDSWGDVTFEPGDILYHQNLIMCTIPFNGVWITFDQGNSWESLNNGLHNLRGRRLVISGQNIFLGAVTSGVWRLGAEFEVFSGNVFNDLNQNGLQDNGEPPLKNIIVSAEPLGSYSSTNDEGSYSLVAASGLDSLRVSLPNAYSSALPPFRLTTTAGTGYDFGIHFTEGATDLKLDLTNWAPFRPGFDNDISVTVSNVGNETVNNGWVDLLIPGSISIQSTDPVGGVVVTNDTLRWFFGALAPFDQAHLHISILVDANATLGDILTISGELFAANDLNLSNNYDAIREIIVGSYDPNDKAAATYITPEDLAAGKPIEYTIRFENTGTFFAEKVVIRDFLEANLNPASFQLISSSHPCTWHMRSDGGITFTLDNLFLLPGETGFIKFSVAADASLELNQAVYNTAEIVFDFNAPIVTNTVKTVVQYELSAADPSDFFQLLVSPNPATEFLNITIPHKALENSQLLQVVDASGKIVQQFTQISGQMRLQLSGLPAGMYQVILLDANQKHKGVARFVVMR